MQDFNLQVERQLSTRDKREQSVPHDYYGSIRGMNRTEYHKALGRSNTAELYHIGINTQCRVEI
jgi:hypothetical protein